MQNKDTVPQLPSDILSIYMHFCCIFKQGRNSFQIIFAYLRNLCYNINVIIIFGLCALGLQHKNLLINVECLASA